MCLASALRVTAERSFHHSLSPPDGRPFSKDILILVSGHCGSGSILVPDKKERNQVHGSLLMLSTKCEDAIRGDEHGEKNVSGWLLLASQNSNNLVIPHLVGRSPVPEVPYKYSVTDSP